MTRTTAVAALIALMIAVCSTAPISTVSMVGTASRFSSCAQKGVFDGVPGLEDGLGCLQMTDLVDHTNAFFENILQQLGLANTDDSGFSGATGLLSDVVKPLIRLVVAAGLKAKGDSTYKDSWKLALASSKGCLGDFSGSEIVTAKAGQPLFDAKCQAMPLSRDAEWTVMSVTVPIFPGMCGAGVLKQTTVGSFCIAVSVCERTKLPTVSVAATGSLMGCIMSQSAVTVASGGTSAVAGAAVASGIDHSATGISLSNAFRKRVRLYTHNGVEEVDAVGGYYDQTAAVISTEKFGLKDIIAMKTEMTRMVAVDGDMGRFVQLFDGHSGGGDVLDSLQSLDFSALLTGKVVYKLALSKITKGAFPDTQSITMGQVSALVSTARTPTAAGSSIAPGVYWYAAADDSIVEAVAELGRYVLSTFDGVLDMIGLFPGVDATEHLEDLLADIKSVSGDAVATAVMLTSSELDFYVKIPLLGTEFEMFCGVKLDGEDKFSCDVKFDGIAKAFTAAIEAVEDGALWVARQSEKLWEDGTDVVGAAFVDVTSDVGDAFESAFSKKSMQKTAQRLLEHPGTGALYDWAQDASKLCGVKMVTSAAKCGVKAVECGYKTVRDAAVCGTHVFNCGKKVVEDGAKCGFETITSASKCGTQIVKCVFSWPPFSKCSEAKSCSVAKSCSIDVQCVGARECQVPNYCDEVQECEDVVPC
mmetsp:Transcript_5770/g.17207  ORF Transcript_5770/g.17207 Transcript_5770/m.17207 type:complete len:701 (-) Transcript_5770:101-2203(-)|eukprot:CAMPEP_0198736560 /NCGR_PEP_ID=MMETSP1475-20131203/66494_1 /TAXON_ID= ORGANISM="Unidentified sp., Strain CCMP1999" /NCGR_SAMPLE_ID=MMETSP1475 /ASSEMBLY_ACC=CAM_ASM_001111 /LENGTH=700 /DNA_ID=CAMNT_0044500387 /DNA_START=37 /DNA_END=2139 /DNA_ORIENTATION=-